MDTFLQNTIRLQQALHQIPHHIHHRLLYTFSAIFTVLAQDSKVDGGNPIYTELPIYYGTKEITTSS